MELDSVSADYYGGFEQIINYLLKHGRKRIGLINGSPVTRTTLEKYKAYRHSLVLHEVEFDPNLYILGKSELSVEEVIGISRIVL